VSGFGVPRRATPRSRAPWVSLRTASLFGVFALCHSACFDRFPSGLIIDDAPASAGAPADDAPPTIDDGVGHDAIVEPVADRGTDGAPPDGRVDAMVDAMADAMPDTMPDATLDAMPDAMPDAIPDQMVVDMQPPDAEVCDTPRPETCNGRDDDCDGETDEDSSGLERCPVDVDGCTQSSVLVCAGGILFCDPDLAQPGDERCNGEDDDCDGMVDEEPLCGPYVERNCTFWLGWSDRDQGVAPGMSAPSWAGCPPDHPDAANPPPASEMACVGTAGDGLFRRLELDGDFNGDDRLAVAFSCDDAANPALAGWIEGHCAIYLGMASERASDGRYTWDEWGPCPDENEGVDGDFHCVSTGFDRQFHALQATGENDNRKGFALALRCVDEQEPERAEALQASFIAVFAFAKDANDGTPDQSDRWSQYPAETGPRGRDIAGEARSASTALDGTFQSFETDWNIDADSAFGIALRADPDRLPPPE